MSSIDLQSFVGAAARDTGLLQKLRRNPVEFAAQMNLPDEELQALQSADLLLELDRDPIGQAALTLTGGVTKTQRHTRPAREVSIATLERLPRRDLVRLLTLSLRDDRFAAKLKADLAL